MALFKFRKGRDEQPVTVAPAMTVEAVRRRAMHRLIGAVVLVLAGVIGFPLIFDNQPRPIPVDLPIEIVDRNKVKPLVIPPPVGSRAAAAPEPASAPAAVRPAAPEKPPAAAGAAAAPPAPAKGADAAETRDDKAVDAKKARSLLEGKTTAPARPAVEARADPAKAEPAKAEPANAASDARFVVQVGAFADPAKVRDVRRKVEAAGLKTYTQVVATSEGERTRVRVGPFPDKEAAAKAAEKIRKLELPAAILTL